MEWYETSGLTNLLLLVLVLSLFELSNKVKELIRQVESFRLQWLKHTSQID